MIFFLHPIVESAKSVSELEACGLSSSEIEDLQQLQRFLLSVTAKDVSLLITFRQVHNCEILKALLRLFRNNIQASENGLHLVPLKRDLN
jgi:hypothetical protein